MLNAKKFLALASVITIASASLIVSMPAAYAAACPVTFETQGSSTDCTFATGVTEITVDVYGASGADAPLGGGGTGNGGTGGSGGRAFANVFITSGEELQFNVGGAGSGTTAGISGAGDMDGGDGGVNTAFSFDSSGAGGAGSDVRRSTFALSDFVAAAGGGGGGGGGAGCSVIGGNGGNGNSGGIAGSTAPYKGVDGGNNGADGGTGGIGSGNGGGGGGGSGASSTQVGNGGGGGSSQAGGTGGSGGTGGNNGANASNVNVGLGTGIGGFAGILGVGGNSTNSSAVGVGVGGGGGGGIRGGGSGGNGGNAPCGQGGGGGGGGGASAVDNATVGFFVLSNSHTLGSEGYIQVSAITSNAPTSGTVGSSFSYAPTTIGFTGSGIVDPADPEWALESGTLPAGLTLNALTGAITGTPTTAGTTNFTLTASYDFGGNFIRRSSQEISLTVAAAAVTTSSVVPAPNSVQGTLAATGDSPMPQFELAFALLVLGSGMAVAAMKKRKLNSSSI